MVSKTIEDINMSMAAVGAVDYARAIDGLSLSQAKLLLSMQGVDAEQQKSLLLQVGLISTSEQMSAKHVQEALANSSLNKTEQERILTKVGLMDAESLELLTSKTCTETKLREFLATTNLDAKEKEAIITKIIGADANGAYAISFDVLTASIWANIKALGAWLISNPIGWAIIAGTAIISLVKLTDALTVSVEEQREKLENLKDEYSEIESELKSLNEELATTQQRMKELEGKGNLSFTEKEEYDNLVKTNNELQRKLSLLELEEKQKRKDRNNAFVLAMDKDTKDPFEYEVNPDGRNAGQYGIDDSYLTSEKGYIKFQFEQRKKLLDDLSNSETKDEQDRIQKQIDEIDKYLQEKNDQWKSDSNGIEYISNPSTDDEKKVNEWLDFINDFQDKMAIAMGADNAKGNAFDRVADNWQFNDVVQDLQDLGKQGKVTAEMLDDTKYDSFIQKLHELGVIDSVDNLEDIALAFNKVGNEAETAAEKINKTPLSFNGKFSRLDNSGISESFKMLKQAMDELSDDGDVTYSTIAEISENFKYAVPNIEKYTKTLLDSSSTAKEMRQAIISLTEEYINNKVASGQLSDADENMVAAMLDEAGVANSDVIAHEMVARAKFLNSLESINLSEATEEDIQKFQAEAETCGITAEEFTSLAKLQAIAQQSMTSVVMTETLARLGIAQSELEGIQTLSEAYSKLASKGKFTSAAQYDANGKLIAIKEENLDADSQAYLNAAKNVIAYKEQLKNLQDQVKGVNGSYKGTAPQYKPSDKNQSKSNKDKTKDTNEQLDDLAKTEALDALKYKFDQLEQSIERVNNALSLLDTTLDLQAEDDYIGKLETITRQLDLAQQKSSLLRDEFNQLSNTTYSSAAEANELANRMKSVADSMAENSKNIIEYGKSITEYYMSAMSSIGSMADNTIERATSLFERNVKTLQEGGLTGLQFNLSPAVPQSAYEKQRNENRKLEDEMRSYYDTVAEMQKTALDMQYQETLADNARKKQELTDSLNEAMSVQEGYSQSSINLQKQTNATTSAEQKQDNQEKTAEEKSFSNIVEGIIVDTNNWMVNNPIKSPGLDKSSWETMVNEAEGYANKVINAFNRASSFGAGTNSGITTKASGTGKIVQTAAQYLGTPYSWGGATPKGFDCSGLVQWSFKQNGKNVPRTSQEQFKGGTPVAKSALSPDDLVFFSTDGSGKASHVGIYVGDGKFIHAPHTGDVVKYSDLNSTYYKEHYLGARRYAKGTKDFAVYGKNINGIAGENYKSEILIQKKTGEMTTIDEPTFIDTSEYDVVGERTTAKVLPQYATGTPTSNSEILSYIKRASEATGVPANILMAVIDQESAYQWLGGTPDNGGLSYGYMQLREPGALSDMDAATRERAKTDKYTNILEGAKVLAKNYRKLGNWGDAASAYNMGMGGFKKYGRNKYGNDVVARANSSAFIEATKNLSSIASNTSDTADNTGDTVSSIVAIRQDFETQLKEWFNGGISTETSETIEDNLLEYIKSNIDLNAYNNDKFIEKWDKFQAINDESTKVIKELENKLLESVGTSDYNAVKDELLKTTSNYIDTMMKASAEANLAELERQYNLNKDVADKMLAFYNQKKEEGATADELSIIIDKYNEQLEKADEISDKWVSTMQSVTEYHMSQDSIKLQAYDNTLSWIEKENEKLSNQYENTDENDIISRINTGKQIVNNYMRIIDENIKKQETAHQNVLDLYNNEEYMPVFERYDVEEWFDANGEATAKYNEELAALNLTNPKLAATMKQLFKIIQQNKKSWYESSEAIQSTNNSYNDFIKTQKLEKVEKWQQYQERLIETLEYEKSLNDAITTAKQSMYDFYDSLREEEKSITAELKANKHLSEWLTEDTRKQLFNDDDYAAEMKVIKELYYDMDALYNDYQRQISSLTEEEAWKSEIITAEYNKQVEALQDKLSLAKQSLQVAKDTAAFENALKERDTQIIRGNGVQNVADPDNLYNLAKAMTDSQAELDNLKIKSQETEDIRNIGRISDEYADNIASIQNNLDMVASMTEKEQEIFSDFLEPIEILTARLNSITKQDPWYMVSQDRSSDIYNSLDKNMYRGYNLAYDNEAAAIMIAQLINAGIFTDEEIGRIKEYLYANHDNKTTTDSHNLGYSLHYPNSETLKGRSPLKMYDIQPIMDIIKNAGVDISEYIVAKGLDEIQQNGTITLGDCPAITGNVEVVLKPYGENTLTLGDCPAITGNVEVVLTPYNTELYQSLSSAANLIPQFNSSMMNGFVGSDNIYSGKPNIGDSVIDNSIHIDNVNIANPVATGDDIVRSLTQKVQSISAITNNQR